MTIKNEEYYLNEVKQDGWALEYVPETLKTEKICLAAVKQNGWALEYVPETLKTEKICLEAVKQNKGALECVPETLKIVYQFEKYVLTYMNGIDVLKGGCTYKTFEYWLAYKGEDLGEYDLNYLNTITKPFIKSILDNRNITKN